MQPDRDSQSFLQIIEANKGIIYKVANAYCKNAEHRKDLVQEILIQLWLAFPKYNAEFKISTWMYRIALNVSISFYRKESFNEKLNQELPGDLLYLRQEELNREDEESLQLLHKFIRELKEIDKAVMLLYLEGTPQQEIADMMGITTSNVSTKIARIKKLLASKFSNVQKL